MPRDTLKPGLVHTQTLTVTEDLTVPRVSPRFTNFANMPRVFPTALMIGFIEDTCVGLLAAHLDEGEITVGSHVDVSHSRATPVGLHVTAEVELTVVDGDRLKFKAICRDDFETIGEGVHERHIVDRGRFATRLHKKRKS